MAKAAQTKSKSDKKMPISGDILYHKKATISCVCGATYEAGSTLQTIRVDICASCHPFFTGESRIVDAEGRVEKFLKKYQMAQKKTK